MTVVSIFVMIFRNSFSSKDAPVFMLKTGDPTNERINHHFMKVLFTLLFILAIPAAESSAKESPFIPVAITSHDIEQCGGWPIARRWYASFIQKANAAGAGRIFIDVAFVAADPLHPESDDYFYDVLLRDENVYLLYPSSESISPNPLILGDRPLPAHRIFSSFTNGIAFAEDHPYVKDSAGLAAKLLRNVRPTQYGAVIEYPTVLLKAQYRFIDVLQNDVSFAGKDIILYVEHAGVTSFVVSPSGEKQATTLLQVWAAEQIIHGSFSILLPQWMFILFFSAATLPFIVVWTIRRKFTGVLISAGCVAFISIGANQSGIFIPSWFLYSSIGWIGAGLVLTAKQHYSGRDKKQEAVIQEVTPENKAEELEALRYQLKYYEQLTQQLPPEKEGVTTNVDGIIFHPKSPLADILKKASQIAESSMPVLISGESGTGKEKLAQFIHHHSPRKHQPFVAVNCSSLNDSLIESELFGHEQGSFTGAVKTKMGRFELAHGGTLFLDEISETSPSFQSKILRVLQEGVVERVGGTKEIRVDVRIIAATNKNLTELTKKGSFREDLFYRLHGFELEIPSLRDRKNDIETLFRHFLYELDPALSYSMQLVEWLKEQRWQGNVRQLQSAIQRAVLNAKMFNRTFIIPKDFEMGSLPNADPLEEGKRIADSVLESLRSYRFDHKSIAKTSADLALHRSTVTEYLRGWVIHFLLKHPGSERTMFDALQGGTEIEELERYHDRIRSYADSILSAIAEGIEKKESPEEIVNHRFRKIPVPFRSDILALIHQRAGTK